MKNRSFRQVAEKLSKMFICKNCKSKDKFELMFSPDYMGDKNYSQKYNDKGDIEITVDGYTFIPDLQFMNQHAVCKYCGQIYMWDYDYSQS